MKLLHYMPSTCLIEGGTVRAAIDLCSSIAQRGHSVKWLTCDNTDIPDTWPNCDANTPTVQMLGPFQNKFNLLTSQQLESATRAIENVDVVHVHGMWNLSNLQIAKTCDMAHKPWVLSLHGMLDEWSMAQRRLKKQIYLETIGRRMVRNATIFHTTAEEERIQASHWLKHDNTAVIPCIVDLHPYKEPPTPHEALATYGKSSQPTVLYLGRVHEKKSIETLIDATKILKDRGVPTRLLIAGTGDQLYINKLKKRIDKCGISEDVKFLGMVVGTLKLSLLAMADIFALPTKQENFGLVYPEAMLCKTAVIGTKGTDIWRELQDGGAVIVERNPSAFADAIEELSSDSGKLIKLGKLGRIHILDWLNMDKVGKNYEFMYRSAINDYRK